MSNTRAHRLSLRKDLDIPISLLANSCRISWRTLCVGAGLLWLGNVSASHAQNAPSPVKNASGTALPTAISTEA